MQTAGQVQARAGASHRRSRTGNLHDAPPSSPHGSTRPATATKPPQGQPSVPDTAPPARPRDSPTRALYVHKVGMSLT